MAGDETLSAEQLHAWLDRLAAVAKQQHIEFYGVLSDPSVTRPEAQKHSKEYKIEFPMLFDASGTERFEAPSAKS